LILVKDRVGFPKQDQGERLDNPSGGPEDIFGQR